MRRKKDGSGGWGDSGGRGAQYRVRTSEYLYFHENNLFATSVQHEYNITVSREKRYTHQYHTMSTIYVAIFIDLVVKYRSRPYIQKLCSSRSC